MSKKSPISIRYFVASPEIEPLIEKIEDARRDAYDASMKLCQEFGAKAGVFDSGLMVGMVFDKHPGEPWISPYSLRGGGKWTRPNQNFTKGREIAARLEQVYMPGGSDILEIVGLKNWSVFNTVEKRIYTPMMRVIDGKRYFLIPEIGENKFEGSDLLTEITKEEYEAERRKA